MSFAKPLHAVVDPAGRRMGRIRVGTTSWTEKTLIESGLFYPPTVKTPEARLNYYASKFPITEVDSSYYALPSERNAAAWVERTPKEFVFHVSGLSTSLS